MTEVTLNQAVVNYQKTESDVDFARVYEKAQGIIKEMANKATRKWSGTDAKMEDFISEGYYRLYCIAKKFDTETGDFENFLRSTLYKAFQNVARNFRREEGVEFMPAFIEEDGETINLLDTESESLTMVESEIFSNVEDRVTFYSAIDGIEDERTKSMVELFLETGSYSEVGRQLGVSYKTVQRAITGLREEFAEWR